MAPFPYLASSPMPLEKRQSFPRLNDFAESTKVIMFDPRRQECVYLDVQFLCDEELEWGGMPRRVDSLQSVPARTPFDARTSENLVGNLDLGQPFVISALLTDGEDTVATCKVDHTILEQMMEVRVTSTHVK
jgi:hypothetical protein